MASDIAPDLPWAGLIGCGGMARDVIEALHAETQTPEVDIVGALVRPGRADVARENFPDVEIFERLDDLLAQGLQIIAEVASQQAVAQYGEQILRNGVDFLVISVGALADAELFERLESAAESGKARMLIPAGAIGGLDAIAAMRLGGLSSARYRSRKPPSAWRGSPAEKVVDLGKLTKPAVLYSGTAREAALLYPQNANVAAAVALAGLGFEQTEVELVADPDAPGNVHEIEVEGAAGRFAITLEGKPSPTNPKTSALAALSVARALRNEQAAIVI
jgi:aspartate dehydrogenase